MLAFGGLPTNFKIPLPEFDFIHFLPRVRVPVLMINGRNDPGGPYETSQLPMYRLLGTREKDKLHRLYEVPGHGVSLDLCKDDILSWLDKYLGKVP